MGLNDWNEWLGRSQRFPASLEAFLHQCRIAGHARTSPILIRYGQGGFNAFHRDLYGDVHFPLQCAVSLGPCDEEGGGAFQLLDSRPGRRARIREIGTNNGDAVIFCTADRPCVVGGIPALQAVLHGVTSIVAPQRYALGLPFHDYRG